METGSIVFLLLSWGAVLGLLAWSYSRILGNKQHFDPDGIGPAEPPAPSDRERRRP